MTRLDPEESALHEKCLFYLWDGRGYFQVQFKCDASPLSPDGQQNLSCRNRLEDERNILTMASTPWFLCFNPLEYGRVPIFLRIPEPNLAKSSNQLNFDTKYRLR